jgi:hypothetical protein
MLIPPDVIEGKKSYHLPFCWLLLGSCIGVSPVEEAGPLFGRDFKRTARGTNTFWRALLRAATMSHGAAAQLYFRCVWWQCGTPGFTVVLEG